MSQSTGDQDIDYYLEQLTEEKAQAPEQIRKSLFRKINSPLGKAVYGWNKIDEYNYQPVRFGKRYDTKEGAPVAGTRVTASELGEVRWANPSSESTIRERLRKER